MARLQHGQGTHGDQYQNHKTKSQRETRRNLDISEIHKFFHGFDDRNGSTQGAASALFDEAALISRHMNGVQKSQFRLESASNLLIQKGEQQIFDILTLTIDSNLI